MNLLVSTTKAVLAVDIERDKVCVLHEGAGLYYGLSWDERCIYLASRPGRDEVEGASIHVYNHQWEHLGDHFLPEVRDLHQVYAVDGELWVASSGQDLFWVYSLETFKPLFQFCPIASKTLGVSDSHHFNSIFVTPDKIYSLAHNRNEGSFVLVHDRQTRSLIERIDGMGFQSHNIYVNPEGAVISLNSGGATITSNQHPDFVRDLPLEHAFPRGLAVTDDSIVVGVSPYESDAEKRLSGLSKVIIYDNSYNHIKNFSLGPYGSVYEVRALNAVDYCHPARALITTFPKPLDEAPSGILSRFLQFFGRG